MLKFDFLAFKSLIVNALRAFPAKLLKILAFSISKVILLILTPYFTIHPTSKVIFFLSLHLK